MTKNNWADAWKARKAIEPGGLLKFVYGKEYHAFNPDVINSLHDAVRSGDISNTKCTPT
jgi:glutamate synthase (NADPH/NADH) large chain